MDARQLEYFLAIVDHDGFGRAAQKLHIAQPSLSQAIAGLERELGVQLFHRTGRGAVLSDADKELIGPARQVLRDLRTARATMDSLKGVRRGRVELVTMPSPGIEPLATLTRLFTQQHPGITVGAEAAFTPDEVVQGVGLAVLPSAWAPLARLAGARTARIDPPAQLHVALLSRSAPLTPATRAFLAVARSSYTPVDRRLPGEEQRP